jgi:serine phosphatase RsbU (regulator of sigma subunit)
MFYGVLNPHRARLDFANGGQFPFPILYDGEKTRSIGGKSPPVGMFEGAEYHTESLEIPPVFGISVFSDGILETLPQPGLSAKQDYLHSLACGTDFDAAALARTLKLDPGTAPPDDISVLSLRRVH